MRPFGELICDALSTREPFALGVIRDIKGSSPQKKGAKALFFADGRIWGTMGGGCLEAEIQDRARRALRTGVPASFDLVLDHDFGWDDGLICGGRVLGLILPQAATAADIWQRVARRDEAVTWGVSDDFSIQLLHDEGGRNWLYQETVLPPCALWLGGAGHVSQAVAPMAQLLDFEVTVFDDRATLASRAFFPEGVRFRVDSWERLVAEPLPARPAFGLVLTRGHQHDAMLMKHWIQKPFAFLGMIGSRRKRRLIFDQLLEEGWARAEALERVACPVGLDIGSISVPEIAVSVVAQLVQQRAALVCR